MNLFICILLSIINFNIGYYTNDHIQHEYICDCKIVNTLESFTKINQSLYLENIELKHNLYIMMEANDDSYNGHTTYNSSYDLIHTSYNDFLNNFKLLKQYIEQDMNHLILSKRNLYSQLIESKKSYMCES